MSGVASIPASAREVHYRRLCGVYFLVLRDEIVYIGQSTDLDGRLKQHAEGHDVREVEFDRCFWIETAKSERSEYERALLRAFRPRCNNRIPPGGKREHEILTMLGIDPALADRRLIEEHNDARRWGSVAEQRRAKKRAA